jgi:hypothetical protein
VTRRKLNLALVVTVGVALLSWRFQRSLLEKRHWAALLVYRNGLVATELARIEASFSHTPPRTIADVTKLVGSPPNVCDDRNEPGPLDDPRAEKCPRGSACHEAFYTADWFVRRHIAPPDRRVWLDPKVETDEASGKLRIRVAGCEPEDRILSIEEPDPSEYSLNEW